jgi:hypothetical protein
VSVYINDQLLFERYSIQYISYPILYHRFQTPILAIFNDLYVKIIRIHSEFNSRTSLTTIHLQLDKIAQVYSI